MPRKLWTTGELLTAADVNTYLANQVITVCTSGARPSSPGNGMFIHETDTGKTMMWNGSAWKARMSGRISWTPLLTSTGTNPTLGTGSSTSGWYTYTPDGVFATFFVKFGTSGVAVGTGNYQLNVPVTGSTVFGAVNSSGFGVTQLGDASSGATQAGTVFLDAPSGGTLFGLAGVGASGSVGPAAPWTWAASDYIAGSIQYPI